MKKLMKKIAVGSTAMLASAHTFAVDHTVEIDAAYVDANTNVTAAVVGIIALVAIVAGVGMIISMLRKA